MSARSITRSVLLALAVAPGLRTPPGHAQTPAFPATTERVVVDVVVSDAEGRPLTGLGREDFVVKEDGVPQAVVEFEAVDAAAPPAEPDAEPTTLAPIATNATTSSPSPSRAFLIVMDDLNLSFAGAEKVSQAVQWFLQVNARESDCITLATTGGGAWWTACGSAERDDLVAALAAVRGRRIPDLSRERMSDYEAMRINADNDAEAARHVAVRYAAMGLSLGSGQTGPAQSVDPLGAADAVSSLVRTMAADVYGRVRLRVETTLRSLERAMAALEGGRGRRVVILASEGFIQDQRLPGFQRVREAARRSNAALYFVDARTLSENAGRGEADLPTVPDPDNRFNYASLAREYAAQEAAGADAMAADTGGFTVRGSDLQQGMRRIGAESRVFYLLGYSPSSSGGPRRFRKIEVQVKRPGAKVRARRGYYPGPPPDDVAAAPKGAPPPPVRRTLDAVEDVKAIPLRMMTYVLGPAAEGRVSVVLSAEADPAALALARKDGRVTGAVASFSTVASRDTGETGRKELRHDLALPEATFGRLAATWLPVTHRYELPPGRYQARVVVLESTSSRLGSVRQTFEVPPLRGLRLATPVLTDVVAPPGAAGEGGGPVPVARRSFGVGSRLLCSVEVWGARESSNAAAVELVYEVRRGDGSVVTRTQARAVPPDERGVRSDVFKLTLQRAGAYELRLQARDAASGEEALAVERFEVVAAPAAPAAGR